MFLLCRTSVFRNFFLNNSEKQPNPVFYKYKCCILSGAWANKGNVFSDVSIWLPFLCMPSTETLNQTHTKPFLRDLETHNIFPVFSKWKLFGKAGVGMGVGSPPRRNQLKTLSSLLIEDEQLHPESSKRDCFWTHFLQQVFLIHLVLGITVTFSLPEFILMDRDEVLS